MSEVEIRFGNGREGIVPLGSYLIDAARRMGVDAVGDCVDLEDHDCAFEIDEGIELLSEMSDAEREHLPEGARKRRTRLACYAKIEKPGVIVVMAKEKKETKPEDKTVDDREEEFRKEFAKLPLEKKIAELMQLEAITLSETFAYVMNGPFKVAEKIGDVMAEFGFQKEADQKERSRPTQDASDKAASNGPRAKPKSTSKKKQQPGQASP